MKFSTEITIVGAKASRGELESGQKYDSTKIYALVDLDNSRGMSIGQAVTEYSWGTSANFDLLRPHCDKLPARFIADFSMVTSGKVSKTVLENVRLKA